MRDLRSSGLNYQEYGIYIDTRRFINSLDEIIEIGKYLLFGLYAKLRFKMGTKSISVYEVVKWKFLLHF